LKVPDGHADAHALVSKKGFLEAGHVESAHACGAHAVHSLEEPPVHSRHPGAQLVQTRETRSGKVP